MIQAEPITAKELFERMVEVPVDNTCRTCRFWNFIAEFKGDAIGICKNNDVWNSLSVRLGGDRIEPPSTFGCIFHQPKEAQNAR